MGFRLSAGERCLSGRLFFLVGGHFSRWVRGTKSCGKILSWTGHGELWSRVEGVGRVAGGSRAMGGRGTGQLKPRPAGHRLRVTLRSDGPSSSPALRTPLLVGWHHLVSPDDSCLPPRRLRFNQVSGSPDSGSESPRQKCQMSLAASCWSGLRLRPASSVSQNSELLSRPCDSLDPSVSCLVLRHPPRTLWVCSPRT